MTKSDKWCLQRLGRSKENREEHFLNIGSTLIGRNKKADVITPSDYCSRNHCEITIAPDGEITIVDKSTNGIFVNGEKAAQGSNDLHENDIIGLGCTYDRLNNAEQSEKEKFYIFKLINKKSIPQTPDDVIDLIDSDDDPSSAHCVVKSNAVANAQSNIVHVKTEVEDIPNRSIPTSPVAGCSRDAFNSDIVVKQEKCLEDVVKEEPIDFADIPQNDEPNENDVNQHDDPEMMYSQQLMLDVKQEAQDSLIDLSLYDESDNEDECEVSQMGWENKLSQDQDKLISKIKESTEAKAPRETKMIESLPAAPQKRRKSVSKDDSKSKSTDNNKVDKLSKKRSKKTAEPEPVAEPELEPITQPEPQPSTSKENRQAEQPQRNADKIDPIASKKREPLQTFEDALDIEYAPVPKKRRISRVISKPKSILRRKNSSKSRKLKKVQFKVKLEDIREFEADSDEESEILIDSDVSKRSSAAISIAQYQSPFQRDPLHKIISDLTEWDPKWLVENDQRLSPSVNGVDHQILPLFEQYLDFSQYRSTIIPLLKHELWSSIEADSKSPRSRSSFDAKINYSGMERRGENMRYVFHARVSDERSGSRIGIGDLCIVKDPSLLPFFCYVTDRRFCREAHIKRTYFTMETSEVVVNPETMKKLKSLRVQPIANLRIEMKLFNSIQGLNESPLGLFILDPTKHYRSNSIRFTPNFDYCFDPLNDEQLEILKSIFYQFANKEREEFEPNLSLIEGPPGTGKSRLTTSIILQLIFGKEMNTRVKILVCASSNAAVDILAKKLLKTRNRISDRGKRGFLSVVRFGIEESMDPEVRCIAPSKLIQREQMTENQSNEIKSMITHRNYLLNEIAGCKKQAGTTQTILNDTIAKYEKRVAQIDELLKQKESSNIAKMDFKSMKDKISGANIVCTTLSSAVNLSDYVQNFDVCLIDEASQCTEPWSLVPLRFNISSLVLIGDRFQLGPVVLSQTCRDNGMETSLFSRIFTQSSAMATGNRPAGRIPAVNTFSLTKQYRMHKDICEWPNEYFYNGRLTTEIPPSKNPPKNFVFHEYNVFKLNFKQTNADDKNFYNEGEALFIKSLLKVLVRHADPSMHGFTYGIITPYAMQKKKIQENIRNSSALKGYEQYLPVNTVDSYQGQERDIIIMSTTRTNGVGFLSNPHRLNVALTRAKKCVVICGNFDSFSNIRVWNSLLSNADQRKRVCAIPKDANEEKMFETVFRFMVKSQKAAVQN